MPISDDAFNTQLDRLIDVFRSGSNKQVFRGWMDEYAEQFQALPWADDAVMRRAVTETLIDETLTSLIGRALPGTGYFAQALRRAKAQLRRESATADQDLTRPALAAPQVREAEAVDPQDPYSCTPEERRRWAEQDVWIRAWARRLPERLPPSAPEWERDAWERNQRVAHWPALTPAMRRAQERRIAGEREQAMAQIRAHMARGERLRAAHQAIVRQGHALGFPAGSVELRDYVQREYTQALAADPLRTQSG